jgi:hypothetical protein
MDYRRISRVLVDRGKKAYRWVEDHTDEVERGCDQVIKHSRGKSYEKTAVTSAETVKRVMGWIDQHGPGDVKK